MSSANHPHARAVPADPSRASDQRVDAHRDERDDTERDTRGRGPGPLSWREWLGVAGDLKDEMRQDHVTLVAGAVAYFAFLALVPTLVAAVSIYGLVSSPEAARQHLQLAAGFLPGPAHAVLVNQLQSVAGRSAGTLGWSAALAIVLALWSASSGTSKLMRAVGIAYDVPHERGFIRQRAVALLLTLGFVMALLGTIFLIAILPVLMSALGWSEATSALIEYGRWPALAIMAAIGLGIVYQVAPNRERPGWRWVSWGAGLATIVWLACSIGFAIYVQNIGTFGETYGSLAGVIVLMLWLFLSALLILLGAELNHVLESHRGRRAASSAG